MKEGVAPSVQDRNQEVNQELFMGAEAEELVKPMCQLQRFEEKRLPGGLFEHAQPQRRSPWFLRFSENLQHNSGPEPVSSSWAK